MAVSTIGKLEFLTSYSKLKKPKPARKSEILYQYRHFHLWLCDKKLRDKFEFCKTNIFQRKNISHDIFSHS